MALTRVKTTALSQGSSFLTSVTANELPAGSVLQMLETRTGSDVNNTTTSYTDCLVLNITPSSSSNKIAVYAALDVLLYASVRVDAVVRLAKVIGGAISNVSERTIYNLHGSGTYYPYTTDATPFLVLDSPNTTSEITYKLQIKKGTSSGTVYHVRGNAMGQSHLMLQEIKA